MRQKLQLVLVSLLLTGSFFASLPVQAQNRFRCWNDAPISQQGTCPAPPQNWKPAFDSCLNTDTYLVENPISPGKCESDFAVFIQGKITELPPDPVVNTPGTNSNTNASANNTPVVTPVVGSGGNALPTCDYNNPNGLCLPANPVCKSGNSNSIACSGNINLFQLISKIVDYLLYFAGVIAVVFVIIGGYYYMTARGNEGQAKSGLATLRNALVGLIITILAYTIVAVVVSFLT